LQISHRQPCNIFACRGFESTPILHAIRQRSLGNYSQLTPKCRFRAHPCSANTSSDSVRSQSIFRRYASFGCWVLPVLLSRVAAICGATRVRENDVRPSVAKV